MSREAPSDKQIFSSADQLAHAQIVREFIEGSDHGGSHRLDVMAPDMRIFVDSYPTDPVTGWGNQGHVGLEGLKTINEAYGNAGFTYDVEIHDIYTCGPVVVVSRTDTRKEEGQPDKPFPAVGVFAFRDGKIVEWSDYYR